MTHDDLSKLSDDEKRVRIAIACGWALEINCQTGEEIRLHPDTGEIGSPPDYLNDLNAALTLCDNRRQAGFGCELHNWVQPAWECQFLKPSETISHPRYPDDYLPVIATADSFTQAICDAFLLTL